MMKTSCVCVDQRATNDSESKQNGGILLRIQGFGDPWVAQQFGTCLWPRAQFWSPGIESRIGLPAWGLLLLCLCLCLSLSVCVSLMNK